MTTSLFPFVLLPALQLNGTFAGTAKLQFFLTGTTTLATVYDADGDPISQAANVNGVVGVTADGFGHFPTIYCDDAVTYRVVLRTKLGVQIGGEVDPYKSFAGEAAASTGATLIGWISRYSSAIAGTVADYLDDRCSVMHFIPFIERVKIRARTSTADLKSYFEAAAATGDEVLLPAGSFNSTPFSCATANTCFRGVGQGTVLHQIGSANATFITVTADQVGLFNMRLEGCATSENLNVFAVLGQTDGCTTYLGGLKVSGPDSGTGFNNAFKFDNGHTVIADNIEIERLWGTQAGAGYGFLLGKILKALLTRIRGVGSPDRGRHLIYKSDGAQDCISDDIYAEGWQYEALTINTHADQPTTKNCQFINATVKNCATKAPSQGNPLNFGSVSMFGNTQDCYFVNLTVIGSLGVGAKFDGTGYSGATGLARCGIRGGAITDSGYIGVDVIAMTGGTFKLDLHEASLASPGTHSNFRVVSDGTTATTDLEVDLNSSGPTNSRSPFQVNPTAPVPTGLKVIGRYATCSVTGVETNGVPVAINGRVRYLVGGFNRPAIAAGGAYVYPGGVPLSGAVVGDPITVTHQVTNTDGCSYFANVNTADNAGLNILFNGSGSSTTATGTLVLQLDKYP